jgi:hypothetical protein
VLSIRESLNKIFERNDFMFLKQLSVFVENKPGRLQAIIEKLSENGVNIRALSIADTTDFGILRMIADDNDKAKAVLAEAGVISTSNDVIAVFIDDKTGGLAKVLNIITNAGISIEYMYAFLGSRNTNHAYMIFHVQDTKAASAALRSAGIKLVEQEEISQL